MGAQPGRRWEEGTGGWWPVAVASLAPRRPMGRAIQRDSGTLTFKDTPSQHHIPHLPLVFYMLAEKVLRNPFAFDLAMGASTYNAKISQ